MPEGAAARELILAERASLLPAGIPWIAFGAAGADAPLRAGEQLRPHRARLRAAFVDWLGRCNAANASPAWWAHTVTAKNLLSSPFGDQVFELLGLKLLLESPAHPRIGVVGATEAQAEVLRRLGLKVQGRGRAERKPVFPRFLYQFVRTLFAWLFALRPRRMADSEAGGLHVVTYADAAFHGGDDAFFGPLADLLEKRSPPLRCRFHAYIHGAFSEVAPRLARAKHRYAPLYAELSLGDLFYALGKSLTALGRGWAPAGALGGLDFTPLLHEALRRDIASGGYFHNLLVGRAALRLARRLSPEHVLYPYENKSLEKLLLLGLREGHPSVRTTGYQHTAVTPRHATLLFAEGEAAATPLPDRIVTCGAVTRAWLLAHSRYPDGLLIEGPALRQRQPERLERREANRAEGIRILFALSSSAGELFAAARLLSEAVAARPAWQFALRPHPEFPLSLLPARLADRARDLSGTPLADNLAWADVVVYASSTVALEALMAGRPVVALDLGEPLEVDPVLEDVPLRWRAQDADGLVRAIEEIAALSDAEYAARAVSAREFTKRCLREPTAERVEVLVGMPPR